MKKFIKLIIISMFCFSINIYSETETVEELQTTEIVEEIDEVVVETESEIVESEESDEVMLDETVTDEELMEEISTEEIVIEVEELEQLQEATPFQIIEIMIEEDMLAEAKDLLDLLSNEEKDSFEYYSIMGKLAKKDGDIENAISLYSKATEKNPDDIYVKMLLLKLRIENNEDKEVIRKEVKEILQLELEAKDREVLEKFAEGLVEKGKSLMANFSTGISYTDNVYETKSEKIQDFYADTRFSLAHKLDLKNDISLVSFASFANRTFAEENEKNSNSFYLGVEPSKIVSTWNISTPITYNSSTEDGEAAVTGFSIGVKGMKPLKGGIILTTGLDMAQTEDEQLNYDGTLTSLYAKANLKAFEGKVKVSPELTYEMTDYNLGSQNYSAFSGSIGAMFVVRETYLVDTSYKLVSKSYDEGGRSDSTHYLKADMESKLGETKWKYNVGFMMKVNTSSESSNEYSANTLSYKIIREFN